MLEAINLSKTFTSDSVDYEALKNINLEIKAGECAAIIGKSGSGKSTLMHLLACLGTPTAGSVLFEGADVSTLSEKERDLIAAVKNKLDELGFSADSIADRQKKAYDGVAI